MLKRFRYWLEANYLILMMKLGRRPKPDLIVSHLRHITEILDEGYGQHPDFLVRRATTDAIRSLKTVIESFEEPD
ncbi:MAG: hypothetical protein GTO14_13940 [Anaerolineales bacterium]|nr:hypothetical protein [Anaerolineales bacterium]